MINWRFFSSLALRLQTKRVSSNSITITLNFNKLFEVRKSEIQHLKFSSSLYSQFNYVKTKKYTRVNKELANYIDH